MDGGETGEVRRESTTVKYREREKWDRKIEFVLSTIGFAVGLGNVWRFPYLCYKNGGGAFLVPYFVCLITGGVPMFFMEIALGQYTSQGGITVWSKIAPLFAGIGYATTVICFLLNIYYIVILAWAVHYFFASFAYELPWATCSNSWNTENCFQPGKHKFNRSDSDSANSSLLQMKETKDSVVEYWENKVLGISNSIEEVGTIQWELAGTLLLSWILVYFCIWKGVKSSGKVVYFTATFPYVMMTILLIRGITLPGAMEGIKFYLTPDFSAIFTSKVWIDAGTQIFFSYAAALGCMIALGSYNKFHYNFLRDCTIIAVTNSATSMYAGFVVFSVLGFMAVQQGVSVAEVAESGPGLVFIAYPACIAQMPWAPLWSFLFFFMIILIGLGSQFVQVEGFITAVVDVFPHILRVGKRREVFIAAVAFVSYLLGLTMVTSGGMYIFQLFDYYSASGMTILWVCFSECIAVSWVYGIGKFTNNIREMVGYYPHIWLTLCWNYLTPILTITIMLCSIIKYEPLTYNKKYEYPLWAQVFGWCLALSSMIMIPATWCYRHTKLEIEKSRLENEKIKNDAHELQQRKKSNVEENGVHNKCTNHVDSKI